MERERFELKVGVFVFVGMVMLGIIISVLGAKQDLFARQYGLSAEFEDVNGLKLGAPVRLAGLDVGLVDRIDFPKTPGDHRLKVRLLVRTDVRDRIRADSTAEIATQGVLGDKYIAISLGTEGEPLRAGAVLPSQPPTNYASLVDSAGKAVDHIRSISAKVDAMLTPESGEAAKNGIQSAAASLSDILGQVKDGHGLLHELIYGDEGASLLADAGKTIADARVAAGNVSAVSADIRSGKGILPALINDPKQKETLDKLGVTVDQLQRTTARLDDIIARIDRGEGTVGALINDPGVYDDLRALLGRAKRNRILRTVIRHQIDKKENLPPGTVPLDEAKMPPSPASPSK